MVWASRARGGAALEPGPFSCLSSCTRAAFLPAPCILSERACERNATKVAVIRWCRHLTREPSYWIARGPLPHNAMSIFPAVVLLATLATQASRPSTGTVRARPDTRNVGADEHQGVLAPTTPLGLVRIELEGFVHEPAGAPAAGVVVVSSAGGKALSDRDGAYRLDVHVPVGTRSVQVTAVDEHGLVASTRAVLPAASRWVQVAPLMLALGNACSPSWLPTFGGTGTSHAINALAVYDDGEGPALHAAGLFLTAGGEPANRIAKWDGSSWKALGGGLSGEVRALAVHDDGSGPALFVGGSFTTAGGAPAARIAKWNGTTWAPLGSGMGGSTGTVYALTVFDDGGGAALYAGGSFASAGGVPASRIARWDGASWSALGAGVSASIGGFVTSLAVHDDGSGPALFVAGGFTSAGGAPANQIARWNGTSWAALGSGLNNNVFALAVFDDGSGAALYAGGWFTGAGPVTANRVARWNGSSWAAVGSGCDDPVLALGAFDDGSGSKLYAGGSFTIAGGTPANRIALWDGSSWQALGSGMDGGVFGAPTREVRALCLYDDGDGSALFAGGLFATAGGLDVNHIAKRDGPGWAALGAGITGTVRALATYDDGTGPALYAGGDFVTAGGVTVNRIGRWDGTNWTALGSGMDGSVLALVVHDDGSGPALFAGGSFDEAGGETVSHIAKWDGSSWSDLDLGVSLGVVRALAVHDDGSGPALYVGGTFLLAGGAFGTTPVNRIAKWSGTTWDNLGTGVNTAGGVVNALASFDHGSGPTLYAGGQFTSVGDVPVNSIARWNGSGWANVGGGLTNPSESVEALAVFGGGGATALYVGGRFNMAGGVSATNIAKWNGASWSPVGSSSPHSSFNERVWALAVHDDGGGAKLHAGGNAGIARLNGSSWTALGAGAQGSVLALTTSDDGNGPSLFAGGQINSFVDSGDSFLGKWGCDRLPPVIFAPPAYAIDRPGNGPGEVVTFSVAVSDNHDPAPALGLAPPSGSWFPLGTTMVTCTATDAAGNESTTQFPVTVQPTKRPGNL